MQEKGDVSESEEVETSDSVSEKKMSLAEALNVANDLWVFLARQKNVPEDVTKSASDIVNYLEDSVVKCSVQKKITDFFSK